MKQKMPKLLMIGTGLAALLVGGLIACQSPQSTNDPQLAGLPGAGVKVRSGGSGSSHGIFVTEIIKIGLEKLGYQTEPVKSLSISVIHTAVSNGDLDLYGTHWERLHHTFFENNGGDRKLQRVGVLVENALQGYLIDKKTADQYNISNLEQLKDPEIAKLFDSDGDGKANLIGCNPGWGCELAIEHHLDAYGLRDRVEHEQGEYEALLIDTMARYRQGKPILYYSYTPHWLGIVLEPGKEAIWLEVPFTSLPKAQGKVTARETSVDGKNLGFVVERVRVLANKDFVEANPAAKRLFELIKIPLADINAQQKLVYNGEDSREDIRRHAEEWVQKNQQQFDGWVSDAVKAVK